MKRRFGVLAVLAFLFLFGFANSSFAQLGSSTAQLNGTVLDESGGAVNKATVTLRETDTNQLYTAATNDSGYYVIPNIVPGHYELKVSFTGFGTYTQTGLNLTVAQTATINVTLKVAMRGEQVVVNTEAPIIEPTKTEISQVIDRQQIESLPTSGRLFTDFALLTPGVSTSRTSLGTTFTDFETTQISFGGMRSFSNEITVDGADFVNDLTGVQRSSPPQESVQEFRVVNNSFGAEYGRALGGIVNVVTKSGGNTLHGSIYNYLQNNATDARSPLQPAPLPYELRQNQFGGVLGGPIKKDKTFFFFNYEGKRRGESPTYAPDLANNIANVDLAKSYLGLNPEGGINGFGGLRSFLKSSNNDYGFARLDHQLNANTRIAIRYSIEDSRNDGELVGQTLDGGGIAGPSGGRNLFIRDQALFGTVNTLLAPNLVNTFLAQYARRHYNFPGATGEPDLSVVNDLEFGNNFGTFRAEYESRAEFSDSLSWVKGSHIIKFGFDGNYIWDWNNYPGFDPERIELPNVGCLYAFADTVEAFRTGTYGTLPTNGAGNLGCQLAPQADGLEFLYQGVSLPRTGFVNGYVPPPATGAGFGGGWPSAYPTNMYSNFAYKLNHGYWGAFIQDQWRLTPKLTVNYGLRWDVESGLEQVVKTDYNAFQPRVGFAFSPDPKTVIRAGFGIFFDRNNMTFFFVTGNQKVISGYLCNPPSADPSCSAGVGSVIAPQVRRGASTGGWQLEAEPGFPGTPALGCTNSTPAGPLPPPFCLGQPGGTLNAAALTAILTLSGAPYSPVSLSGTCNLTPGGPAGACGVGAGGIQRNGRLPYAEQASLQIDREIGKGFTIGAGYLFVEAHKLVRGNNINVPCPDGTAKPGNPYTSQGILDPSGSLTPCPGTPTLGTFGLGPFFAYLNNPANPQLPYNPSGLEFGVPGAAPGNPAPTLSAGLLDYNNNVVNAAYSGLTITGTEHWGQILTLTANYTWSHTIDNGNFTTFINLPPNQFDYGSERGNSNQDIRQRFVTNFTATAPLDSFARKFAFSSIITLQSGRPFTLYAGQDVLGDVAGLSTDRVGGAPIDSSCPSVSDCNTMLGRNTYLGDPLYSWDLRLSRWFQLRENLRLDLSVDAFNALNRANFDEITSVYGSPVFCGGTPAIPKRYNDTLTRAIQNGSVSCGSQQAATIGAAPFNFPGGTFVENGLIPPSIPNSPNSTFGVPRTAFNPRQFQFAAKFSF